MNPQISLQELEKRPNLKDFSCGVSTIDAQTKDIYYATCLHQGMAYQIIVNNIVCGYMFATPYFIQEEDSEYESATMHNSYPVIYIKFIAVQTEYQRNGIGQTALKMFLKTAQMWHDTVPFRYVVIDALQTLVPFYRNLGFDNIDLAGEAVNSATIWMALDLLTATEQQKLDQYITEELA